MASTCGLASAIAATMSSILIPEEPLMSASTFGPFVGMWQITQRGNDKDTGSHWYVLASNENEAIQYHLSDHVCSPDVVYQARRMSDCETLNAFGRIMLVRDWVLALGAKPGAFESAPERF